MTRGVNVDEPSSPESLNRLREATSTVVVLT